MFKYLFFYKCKGELEIKILELPIVPRVVVRDLAVIIIEENGDELLWGYESTFFKAEETAKEIETGLKAIQYIKNQLLDAIEDIKADLLNLDIPEEHINQYLYEGYESLRIKMVDLENQTLPKTRPKHF